MRLHVNVNIPAPWILVDAFTVHDMTRLIFGLRRFGELEGESAAAHIGAAGVPGADGEVLSVA